MLTLTFGKELIIIGGLAEKFSCRQDRSAETSVLFFALTGSPRQSCSCISGFASFTVSQSDQGVQCKAKSGEVGQAGMGGLLLPPNSQKAEFTHSK